MAGCRNATRYAHRTVDGEPNRHATRHAYCIGDRQMSCYAVAKNHVIRHLAAIGVSGGRYLQVSGGVHKPGRQNFTCGKPVDVPVGGRRLSERVANVTMLCNHA